jgi:hypothetical protein
MIYDTDFINFNLIKREKEFIFRYKNVTYAEITLTEVRLYNKVHSRDVFNIVWRRAKPILHALQYKVDVESEWITNNTQRCNLSHLVYVELLWNNHYPIR